MVLKSEMSGPNRNIDQSEPGGSERWKLRTKALAEVYCGFNKLRAQV